MAHDKGSRGGDPGPSDDFVLLPAERPSDTASNSKLQARNGGPVLGIDPGLVGGWAVVDDRDDLLAAGDIPVVGDGTRRTVSAVLFADVISRYQISQAVIEHVGAMPGQGVSSMFRFGQATGIVHGVIGALKIPTLTVAATVWKRHYGLGPDKEAARKRAIEQWPAEAANLFSRKMDHGRAEAALIALWGVKALRIGGRWS